MTKVNRQSYYYVPKHPVAEIVFSHYITNVILRIHLRAYGVAQGNYTNTRKDVASCAKEVRTDIY